MYDQQHISQFFDEFGEKEWARLDQSAEGRVSFHIHTRFLEKFIASGDRVLEAGAGAGRFTRELIKLGAELVVGDVSQVQLDLNVRYAGGGFQRRKLDIVDLSEFADDSFEACVAYGGPLSYVMDRAPQALDELLRVIKPGGYLLLSVMSLLGATRKHLQAVLELPEEERETVVATGVLHGEHRCRMYRWSQLKELLESRPCRIVAASASNFLSVNQQHEVLDWEVQFCQEPGALDGGTHIIAVVQKHPTHCAG